MANNETHVAFSVKHLGLENESLIIMVNSWMDAPVRKLGRSHRRTCHSVQTMLDACVEFGNVKNGVIIWDKRNKLITMIVLHHLLLDGIVTRNRAKNVFKSITGRNWKKKLSPPPILEKPKFIRNLFKW